MKKTLLSIVAAAMSLAALAQTDVWVWQNGKATKMAAADSITFTEPVTSYKAVDLGLSVKWATCNVGATTPTEYGDYFAWGETTPKTDYSWSTYKFTTDGGSTFTKYNATDKKTILEPEDDAAYANWGGAWRMPTKAEIEEILNTDNCTWTWYAEGNTKYNGVAGYEVASKKSGYTDKSIFLPAAGHRGGSTLGGAGQYGHCWSATLGAGYVQGAYDMFFSSDIRDWYGYGRYNGFTVRPVCP